MKNKTILIMAGGTGGHVFPGLALANILKNKGWNVHWLGTAERLEAKLVPEAGYPIHFISISGVRGNGVLRLLITPFKLIKVLFQAFIVVRRIQPDLVVGMGGFASGPGGLVARLSGIPLVLHEQNAVPGLTNKWLARFANKILVGFAQAADCFGHSSATWVGNPVRVEFSKVSPVQVRDSMRILVIGGSLGARVLNLHLPRLLGNRANIQVMHQCGAGHVAETEACYRETHGTNWQVTEFIEDMASAYDWANLIICRAGALTVSEVAMAGRASVFVPLPHAVDDHQTKNAQTLVERNAAILLPQSELVAGKVTDTIISLLDEPDRIEKMGQLARQFAKPEAAKMMASVCEEMVQAA
jgi:UDP-N-acetylglucosamine--N-acetylmuramyl-(pentapeptide) pyrophosphoryl-undecaprenol N-acetylglucosamine transferase